MSDRPAQPPDPNRRRFFRQFAGDVVSSMGSVLGAASVLQQQSAEAAREILGTTEAVTVASDQVALEEDATTAGYRAPFRWDGDVCHVVDQRRLPDVITSLQVRGAADAVNAINEGALIGAAVQAQVAAVTVALVAGSVALSRPFARRATIRGAANALRLTRPGSAALGGALDRQLALVEQLGLDVDGDTVAAAIRAETEAILLEAQAEHGSLVEHALAALPGAPDEPIHLLTIGSSGAMAGGQFGTALSVILTLHHTGRPVHALVSETRPLFEGSRVAAWELRQAGVPYAVVTDAAAPGCIAAGEVAAVLVAADRVAANGDVIAIAGSYPLALAAAAAGIPYLVCAPASALDPAVADGEVATIEEGRPGSVLRAAGTRVAPEGSQIRNPLQDLTPAALVTGIVTSEGVLRAPYGPAIEAAAAAADGRRTSAGFAALLAQRAVKAREAAALEESGGAVDGTAGAGMAHDGRADDEADAGSADDEAERHEDRVGHPFTRRHAPAEATVEGTS